MKKIFVKIALLLAVAAAAMSCGKFEPGGTSTQNLAGDWVCTVYCDDGTGFAVDNYCTLQTYNTSDDNGDIWINDYEGYWGTYCRVDASNSARTFGKAGKEYEDMYNGVGQLIWGGKVTPKGAVSPDGHVTDKIEFFIAFSDDDADGDHNPDPYCCAYYFVGYQQTGFKADQVDGEYVPKFDWDVPAVPEIPAVTEPLPVAAP